jgi:DNA-binding response OmpR family regulator
VGQYKKVLIVEDHEVFADNLQTHFERCGWNARIACNGKVAVAAAEEFRPELILLDFHLPDMSGFQVLDAIRASSHCCACMLMTGHPTDTVLTDARQRGISHILSKPFSMIDLTRFLSAAG